MAQFIAQYVLLIFFEITYLDTYHNVHSILKKSGAATYVRDQHLRSITRDEKYHAEFGFSLAI